MLTGRAGPDPQDGTLPPLLCLPSPASATGLLTVLPACLRLHRPAASTPLRPCLPHKQPTAHLPPRLGSHPSPLCSLSWARGTSLRPAPCPPLRPPCAWCSPPHPAPRAACGVLRAQASGEAEPGSSPASSAAHYKNHLAPGKLLPQPVKGEESSLPRRLLDSAAHAACGGGGWGEGGEVAGKFSRGYLSP